MRFAGIAIPLPVHSSFTYAIPDGMPLTEGSRAVVPFKRGKTVGLCIEITDSPASNFDLSKIKNIEAVLDDEMPTLDSSLLKLVKWISTYYCAPIGEVVRAALPARLLNLNSPKTTRPAPPSEIEPHHQAPVKLTSDQKNALDAVSRAVEDGLHTAFLLHGVTGSGKTEVYFTLFEKLISMGKQGLLLVPEIGLTPQLTGRAVARFGDRVAIYHSGLTDAQRHMQWMRMSKGLADIVIGTRSALFAPLPNLGAIVVDEEHDASYKQDDGVTYNGRDSAIMRAHIASIPALLGSATPSIESMANAKSGKYAYHVLSSRPGGSVMPSIEIVDMKKDRMRREKIEDSDGQKIRREFVSLSPRLYDAISETLAQKEQALIYIGRRGFANALQCMACGEVCACPNCDISLSVHHGRIELGAGKSLMGGPRENALSCHYCGYSVSIPQKCSSCNRGSLEPVGHGTERIEAELADFFPDARIARLDSDTAGNSAKRQKILGDMRKGKIDILVGTQMVTKGHDFPSITLVGVVSADSALNFPDFRSAERTFQLLTQVAGRAGRGEKAGRVIIQTREPNHPSIISARDHDCAAFIEKEIEHRRALAYPPFAKLANIKMSSAKEKEAEKSALGAKAILEAARSKIGGAEKMSILGPSPAPIYKLRNRFRWQMLVKSPDSRMLATLLSLARPAIAKSFPSGVRVLVDVDPINLL